MVQLSLALACLLAGADAFAPIPTKVPHHTHEEPDTHEVPHHTHESESPTPSASPSPTPSAPPSPSAPVIVPKFSVYKGSCDSKDLVKIMWDDGVTAPGVGIVIDFPPYTINPSKPIITADDCWEACMAYGNDVFDGTIQDGTKPMQPTFSFQDDSAAQGGVKCFCMDCHHYVSADSESCWRAQDSDSILAEADSKVGTLSTLAAPDWTPPAACPVPFSKHQGVCGDSIAKISKGAEVISTATKCWEACEMYKFAEPAHIYDSINSSCECRDKCTCWEDSANEGQAAARFTTLALPDWVPPNPDPNTAAEWATIFTAGEMCDGSA